MPWEFQWMHRVDEWIAAHPEYESAVMAWRFAFRADPEDERLQRQRVPHALHTEIYAYPVPRAPLLVIVLVELPDEQRPRWVRILECRGG